MGLNATQTAALGTAVTTAAQSGGRITPEEARTIVSDALTAGVSVSDVRDALGAMTLDATSRTALGTELSSTEFRGGLAARTEGMPSPAPTGRVRTTATPPVDLGADMTGRMTRAHEAL